MLICCELLPVARLKVSAVGLVVSAGGAITLMATLIDCGLPVMAIPLLSTAASEIAPVYDPAVRADEVTVIVKVAELLLAMVALAGVTASQPLPLLIVAVGVTVTLPEQAPITLMVKVCAVGLRPASLENVVAVVDGACKVQGGCTFKVIDTTCGVPTGK